MRCKYRGCNGTIIFYQGYGQEPDEWKCHSCGRLIAYREKEGKIVEIQRDAEGKVIVPKGYIYTKEHINKKGEVVKEHYKKYGYKKKKEDSPAQPGPVEVKVCTRCHKWWPFSEFHINKSHKGGLESICKECKRVESRDRIRKVRGNEATKDPLPLTVATPDEIMIALNKGFAVRAINALKKEFGL